jgi:hypothetical protein
MYMLTELIFGAEKRSLGGRSFVVPGAGQLDYEAGAAQRRARGGRFGIDAAAV